MENKHYSFITDCLADPGNATKQQALDQWLAASEEHRVLFREVKVLWETAGGLPATPLDQAAGWEALSQHIAQKPAAQVRRIRGGWWKAAAVLLPLLMVTGYWFYHMARNNETIHYTAGNAKDSLLLPDGTAVYLQQGARLSWISNFKERRVQLEAGEAFFKVAKDEQHTFSVSAANASVKVLGTAFNVKTTAGSTDVVVWEGKVSLGSDQQPAVILGAGEMGVVGTDKGKAHKLEGNYKYRCGWANNDFVFINQPLALIMRMFSTHYHIDLKLADTSLLSRRVTVRFSHLQQEEAIKVLSAVIDDEMQKNEIH